MRSYYDHPTLLYENSSGPIRALLVFPSSLSTLSLTSLEVSVLSTLPACPLTRVGDVSFVLTSQKGCFTARPLSGSIDGGARARRRNLRFCPQRNYRLRSEKIDLSHRLGRCQLPECHQVGEEVER